MRKKYTIIEHKVNKKTGGIDASVELVSVYDVDDAAERVQTLRNKAKVSTYMYGFEPFLYTVKIENVSELTVQVEKVMEAFDYPTYSKEDIRMTIHQLIEQGMLRVE